MPQRSIENRIVWAMFNDGIYNVKTGYYFWHNHNVVGSLCTRAGGGNKLWRLKFFPEYSAEIIYQ